MHLFYKMLRILQHHHEYKINLNVKKGLKKLKQQSDIKFNLECNLNKNIFFAKIKN